MWSILSIFILSAGTVLSAESTAAADFDGLIRQGRASFLAFDLDSAQAAYAQACPVDRIATLPLRETARCEHELGVLAEARGHDDETESHYLKALAAWDKLGSPYLAHDIVTMTNLGAVYRRRRRLSDAEQLLGRALELSKTLAGPDTELYEIVRSRLGGVYGDLDQPDRARQMLEQAIAGFNALAPPDASELAFAYSSLGMIDIGSGRYKSGESNLRQSLELAQQNLGEASPETAAYATNLALALLSEGQYDRAATLLRRARFVIESRLGPESVQLVNVLAELTSAETGLGRFRIAEGDGEQAMKILARYVPQGSPEILLTQVAIANLYLREHKIAEAEKILPAAVEAERRVLGNERILGTGIRTLASLRAQQHAWSDAEALYREAIGIYERRFGAEHPDLAPLLREYAMVLKHRGAPRDGHAATSRVSPAQNRRG